MKVGETKSAVTHGFHHAFEIISGEYDRSHFDFAFTKDTIKTVVCKVQEPCVRHQRKYGSNIIQYVPSYDSYVQYVYVYNYVVVLSKYFRTKINVVLYSTVRTYEGTFVQ